MLTSQHLMLGLRLSGHTHSLSPLFTFLCCVSESSAGTRSAWTTMASSQAGREKGDTFPKFSGVKGGRRRGTPIDAGKGVFSQGRHLELLWDHYSLRIGERLGSSEPNSSNYAAGRQSPASLFTPVHSYPLHKGVLCAYAFVREREGLVHLHSLILLTLLWQQEDKRM